MSVPVPISSSSSVRVRVCACTAFVLENAPIDDGRELTSFLVPLAQLEQQAGVSLFPALGRDEALGALAPSGSSSGSARGAAPLCARTACVLPPVDFYRKAAKAAA
jgi:hypothetical protein